MLILKILLKNETYKFNIKIYILNQIYFTYNNMYLTFVFYQLIRLTYIGNTPKPHFFKIRENIFNLY